ncbi:SAM-dependent methyltransferase [Saccharopolyspora hattusasensis]|uniref:SAM-dependent methyltransferase n=1 Tax=Saccharopolyspora hattusasensis TaxID=1128679 RepID=UPI003D9945D9
MPDSSIPPTIDTSVASIARVYDCFLGGKDNFEADRVVYRNVRDIAPEAPALAVAGRRFLSRAVTYLADEAGIDQFLDLGCGLPTADNTHQIAQRCNRQARVVYVDNDPSVAAHARVMLTDDPDVDFAVADLRDPAAVLNHPTVQAALDFTRPIALLQAGTLHHLDDDEQPAEIMRTYIDALTAGSYVVLSHFHNPGDGSDHAELAREIEHRLRSSSMQTSRFRSLDDIRTFLAGLVLVPSSPLPGAPGIVPVREWWPPGPCLRQPRPTDELLVGALARKPR